MPALLFVTMLDADPRQIFSPLLSGVLLSVGAMAALFFVFSPRRLSGSDRIIGALSSYYVNAGNLGDPHRRVRAARRLPRGRRCRATCPVPLRGITVRRLQRRSHPHHHGTLADHRAEEPLSPGDRLSPGHVRSWPL